MASDDPRRPAGFGGRLLEPSDADYDEARRVWNAMIDRHPAVILQPTSTADVQAAVRLARHRELEISVRGGGHSVVGHGVTDGGLMIDLSSMRDIQVDADSHAATVQGGALLRHLDAATAPHGMHVPAGIVSHTGVGGLVLGGGEGWLGRHHGLACDNLRRATVVTADGELVIASATDDSDLLWALRGGGGNFGIVTEFTFDLHPVDGRVQSVDCFYGADDGEAMLRAFREIALDAPEEATFGAWVGTAGPWPFLPANLHGQTLVNMSFVHVGDPARADGLREAMRAAAPVIHESEEQMTFVELQAASDQAMAHGMRRYWKSHYLSELSDPAIAAFLSRGGRPPEGGMLANGSIEARGGAQARVGVSETAFANRDARFNWITMAAWEDPSEDEMRMGAARRFGRAMAPYSSGVYVNALAESGDAAGLAAAYRPAHLARLSKLKARFDPGNVFHLNQNIAPADA